MVARGAVCSKCKHRLSVPTTNSTEFKCPTCNMMNPVPLYEQRRNSDRSIKKLIVKVKEKISGNDLTSSKNPDSLNKKPSPLEISGSSSETRPAGKRALLIGVIYKSEHKLKGTINDVKSMREFLILNCGFKEENILVLTDQEIEPELVPTKKDILESLEWLMKGCQAGDSLVFYFSGHGVSQPDFDGDERDGISETICPVDFITEGMIVDNDIKSAIVWPLKNGVTLHAIVDACHSGTVLDLEHVYNRQELKMHISSCNRNKWEDNSPPSGNARKHSDGGLAISLSACLDNQVAADTTVR
ncbi:hypothetical protein DKX38_026762 [Salix brachista]|uniref:Peptidase C14 caspase domain-containing protein n=1 Tax=Salix brachista TaxID=2182728 RepID=A0A5N5JE19_9ROSI|nr:hypothetical protein DKX38_026762 [Salix brachista]